MKTQFQVPKELLAEIDFHNTINGGRFDPVVKSRTTHSCCYLILSLPSINPGIVKVQVADKRLKVYIPIKVIDNTKHVCHYLVNMPISTDIDVTNIKAQWATDGRLHIKMPFTDDWKTGKPNDAHIRLN
jgi:HSP20 family protein